MASSRSRRYRWQFLVISAALLALIAFATFPSTTTQITTTPIRRFSIAEFSKHADLAYGDLTIRASDRNDADPTWLPAEMQTYMGLPEERIDSLVISEENKKKLRAARKGLVHFCRMRALEESALLANPAFKPSSTESAAQILDKFGWSPQLNRGATLTGHSLGNALVDLGISEASTDWFLTIVRHNQPSDGGGTGAYPATNANYNNRLNLRDGVLLAVSNWGPEAMIREMHLPISGAQVVPLQRYSDVVWLAREKAIVEYRDTLINEGKSPAKLEHVFRVAIINGETIKVLQMVTAKRMPHEVGPWPGLSYPISEPQALAALSAPNCYAKKGLFLECKKKTPLADISIPQSIYQQHSELEFYSWHVDIPSDHFDLSFAENIDYYPDLGISPGPPH
ncbi:hypothetical protein Slin14017_G034550 [Septoria linicola]|nr:hypothetical protein Slin14017_G034550 [Septoria linicola]